MGLHQQGGAARHYCSAFGYRHDARRFYRRKAAESSQSFNDPQTCDNDAAASWYTRFSEGNGLVGMKRHAGAQGVSIEQLRYARVLNFGMRFGLYTLLLSFA